MNFGYGWAALFSVLVILIFHFSKRLFRLLSSSSSYPPPPPKRHLVSSPAASTTDIASSNSRISEIVSEADLKFLIDNLDEKLTEKWENVINKRNNLLAYTAKCFKPKDAPIKYVSVTVFENCTTEMLRDFYMDSDYRKKWDNTIVEHEQLQVDRTSGIEIGRTIKKFPFLTRREYILGWRLWEGKDKTFYCFIKVIIYCNQFESIT
ncbi:unnamed protein product [Dovyalis caffra]|uniref:START domain-containing protein n=1 Tax=Dovyalis caffra TaxID=77055 RepID=A0AAV1RU13_9ROSI|nr:unnamed protein product [Dovyalis caffra]